jgi:RNA polymerase sigma-70 factor, ECF subfamily
MTEQRSLLRRRVSPRSSDADVLAFLAAGDPAAFAEAYERYGDAVYRFALRLCGQQEAEDVTREVFLGLWRAPNDFEVYAGSLRMALLVRAHGQALIGQRISGLLSRLSDAEHGAIALAYFGEYTYEQVAAAVHLPDAAVAADIHAGLRRLTMKPR